MALERGSDTEGNHREPVLGADRDRVGDLPGGLGEQHAVGRDRLVVALVLPVPVADRLRQRQPVAETLFQDTEDTVADLGIGRPRIDVHGDTSGSLSGAHATSRRLAPASCCATSLA